MLRRKEICLNFFKIFCGWTPRQSISRFAAPPAFMLCGHRSSPGSPPVIPESLCARLWGSTALGNDILSRIKLRTARDEDYVYVKQFWKENFPLVSEPLKFFHHMRKFVGDGAIVAELDDAVVGHAFGVVFDDDNAAGGWFIVRKDLRQRGIGDMIYQKRLEHLGTRNFGIYSVPNRVEKNKLMGINITSYSIIFFAGIANRAALAIDASEPAYGVVDIAEVALDKFMKYDNEMHANVPRATFVKDLISDPDIKTVVCLAEDGEIKGYSMLRKNEGTGSNYLIWPLYGDESRVWKLLLNKLLEPLSHDTSIGLLSPMENKEAYNLALSLGLKEEFRLPKMYSKCDVPLALHKVASVMELAVTID